MNWLSAGRLEAELLSITKRVSDVLRMLPKDITPVNLEELRRVKQVLVELESKADTLRCAPVPANKSIILVLEWPPATDCLTSSGFNFGAVSFPVTTSANIAPRVLRLVERPCRRHIIHSTAKVHNSTQQLTTYKFGLFVV